ncbi:concanavalin A-like lectin/glucanase [Trametes cingulata]|nr:concanavalin A-like lectin/glucanase [Trametes cingulata]
MKLLHLVCLGLSGLSLGSVAAGIAHDSVSGSLSSGSNSGLRHLTRSSTAQCEPFNVTLSVSQGAAFSRLFVPTSPPDSYELDLEGLKLFLDRPNGNIHTKGRVNDKVSEGATINSTITLLHGKVTYTFSGPAVPGVVTAAILIADEHDEIDVELVGGDPQHWQTNVFAPAAQDKQPLYGVFGEIEDYAHAPKNVKETHSYTIDWNAERIQWSVDGSVVRTLRKGDTKKNGALHYPSHPARLQLGIWDASAPAGTSEWAHGPIDWDKAPSRMSAVFERIQVECPY